MSGSRNQAHIFFLSFKEKNIIQTYFAQNLSRLNKKILLSRYRNRNIDRLAVIKVCLDLLGSRKETFKCYRLQKVIYSLVRVAFGGIFGMSGGKYNFGFLW